MIAVMAVMARVAAAGNHREFLFHHLAISFTCGCVHRCISLVHIDWVVMQHAFVVSLCGRLCCCSLVAAIPISATSNYNYKFVLLCVVIMLLQQLDLCCHSTASEILSHIIAGSCQQLVDPSPQSVYTCTSTNLRFSSYQLFMHAYVCKRNFELLCEKLKLAEIDS